MLFLIFVSVVGLCFVALAIVRLSSGHGRDDTGGDDGGPGWRRGGGPWPRGPRPKSPEPTWWPEFERQFRAYDKAQTAATRHTISGTSP
jgi:hypothetical protein